MTPKGIAHTKAYQQSPAGRAAARKAARARNAPKRIPRHMYIMRFVEHPDVFKVGRADDIQKRRSSLNAGLFLTLEIVAQYENLGHIEPDVHDHLDQYRVASSNSREWFRCPLDHIKNTISYVISNIAASSSEAPVQSVSEDLDHPGESDEEDAC